ncbi:MAG: hypothetical protein SFV21_09960 [Rhodospirillaceae bacterium]|nr:hypothetical protein [Rhodospirillaceae bacterium]
MPVRDRVSRHRKALKAQALVRVEVVVPEEYRDQVKAYARKLVRKRAHGQLETVRARIADAYARFGASCLDNIAVHAETATFGQARVIADALMRRGNRDAFLIGREIADAIGPA